MENIPETNNPNSSEPNDLVAPSSKSEEKPDLSKPSQKLARLLRDIEEGRVDPNDLSQIIDDTSNDNPQSSQAIDLEAIRKDELTKRRDRNG